jgi:hypothetical protein
MCVTANSISVFGVKAVFVATFSWMVSTFIACCITTLCLAPLGIGMNVTGGGVSQIVDITTPWRIRCDLRCPCASLLMSPLLLVINGNAPGVLCRVTRRCTLGLFLSIRFAVGFLDCIIASAFVMRGVGTLQNGYIRNVPLPRVAPWVQSASHVMSHSAEPRTCYSQVPRVPTCSEHSRALTGLGGTGPSLFFPVGWCRP